MRELFTSIDLDGSGTLTVEELGGALVDFPDIAAEIGTLVDGIDLDGNRSIDYNEFIAATLSRNTYIREENIK
jgi:calcium-dependent protein kinase